MNLTVNNAPKFVVMVLLVIGATLLRSLDQIDQVTYVALIGPIGGYAVGNGIAARNGDVVEPMLAARRRPHPERIVVDDTPGVFVPDAPADDDGGE